MGYIAPITFQGNLRSITKDYTQQKKFKREYLCPGVSALWNDRLNTYIAMLLIWQINLISKYKKAMMRFQEKYGCFL